MARYEVRGRVALITGGGRGIGLALGEALVSRGANVALVDLDERQVGAAAVGLGAERALGIKADVSDRAGIEAAVAQTVSRFGGIDVVVANAGIAPVPAPVRAMPAAEFERVVEVNLLGVYRTVSAALEQIIARRGQAVVVSSVYAFANGMLNAPYAVAKAGVEQLGRALRLELSIHGASATVAYFGFVDTQMVRDAFEHGRARSGQEEDEVLPAWLLKRITPQQAAEALAGAIERRAPRLIAPRWWAAGSVLRGLLSPPFDYLAEHSPRVRDSLRRSEAGARQASRERSGELGSGAGPERAEDSGPGAEPESSGGSGPGPGPPAQAP